MKHPIVNVMEKEWRLLRQDRNSLLMFLLMPVLINVQFILVTLLVGRFVPLETVQVTIMGRGLSQMAALFDIGALSAIEQFQLYLLLLYPFYLILIPTMLAGVFSIFSILEEKTSQLLEPLFITPMKKRDFLLGKTFSGVVPGVIVTWISAVIFLLILLIAGKASLIGMIVSFPGWFYSLLVNVPLAALLSYLLGVNISSAATDSKNAQGVVVIIILPVLALVGLQASGLLPLNLLVPFLLSLGLLALSAGSLMLSVRLLSRENIASRWRA